MSQKGFSTMISLINNIRKKKYQIVVLLIFFFSLILFSNAKATSVPTFIGREGDLISATGDPDIYIVNGQGHKRLFLNPIIFKFYGHLGGFQDVIRVSTGMRDNLSTSGLFRNCELNDLKVYAVEVTEEDSGILHWVNIEGSKAKAEDPSFFKKIFCINNNEFNWYTKNGTVFGSDYSAVSQILTYPRIPDSLVEYFINQMQSEYIEEFGQPIEGFTPGMFKQAFPRLTDMDFHGVKAAQGIYLVENNELVFKENKGVSLHSAASAISKKGMETLLQKLSNRTGIPIKDTSSIDMIFAFINITIFIKIE